MPRSSAIVLLAALTAALAGCDQLGIESATAVSARREAEGKAVGGACRQAARSIEQCYDANKRADKAAVYAGWREMNDYMRENKLEAMPAPAPAAVAEAEAEPDDEGAAKPRAGKAGGAARAGRSAASAPAAGSKGAAASHGAHG